jgi:hypothetical protein
MAATEDNAYHVIPIALMDALDPGHMWAKADAINATLASTKMGFVNF